MADDTEAISDVAPDDRWGYRAKRDAFLAEFGSPGTPEGDRMKEALDGITDALLQEARYHATWPVATAEKWRYDRMLWVFGVMLGEVPADSLAPSVDEHPDEWKPLPWDQR
jgi:hypothetical protein